MTSLTKEFMKILKEVDSDMTYSMRSHYKKQFEEIVEGDKEQNLIFKLLEKISEQEDELEELKTENKAMKKYRPPEKY
jgi:hypothetical protein